jgi:hypothetical protein
MACGPEFGFEGGLRLFYTNNYIRFWHNDGPYIDFVEHLKFAPNTLVGEVYGSVRMPPKLALTYTYMIPREDDGYGILPVPVIVDDTLFAAGTAVAAKSIRSRHRWEGEYNLFVGCSARGGPMLLGELLVHYFEMKDAQQSDREQKTAFMLGVGGSGEWAPSPNIFAKVKAAYTFLDSQSGAYVDGECKFFPEFNKCGPGGFGGGLGGGKQDSRPYASFGYRFRTQTWTEGDVKAELTVHGPYASVGIVF